ncbi:MAG: alanine racemase [Candidatus Omnitrophica bacterium]|nr:alanine racemase [Candidatus Omnitrophota bacterium]MDD5662408.1 alanine racemase [Candidatus Omnitrophota bacterium]
MPTAEHIGYRPTWAEIDLNNLEYNFLRIKERIACGTKILVTVKADAYGHGLIPTSERLESCGVDFLGVASIDEGIALRKAGIKSPILVLGLILKDHLSPLFEYDLTISVCDEELSAALNNKARLLRKKAKVHIKVDTGMGRIGILHYDAHKLVRKIHRFKHIKIEGIFTHFAFADINRKFTFYQIDLFDALIQKLAAEGITIPLVHAANSMGILSYCHSHFNMVRPGLVIYGLYPKGNLKVSLKPVLSLKTRVVFIKNVPAGCGISYGHEYITARPTRIVTLPIGYGDGYPRNLSNKAPVLIGGKRFRICGRICMDQIMVDVGKAAVKIGEEAVLIGAQGKNMITTEELAGLSKTIPYEIVCGLGSRIPRVSVC